MTNRITNTLKEPIVLDNKILVEKTMRTYGYDPRYLKPSSCRHVLWVCPVCLREICSRFRSAVKSSSCADCANKTRAMESAKNKSLLMLDFYAAGGKHPMSGKKHSEESRRKMSETRRSLPHSEERAAASRIVLEQIRSRPDYLINLRTACAKAGALRTGRNSPSYGKPPAHATKVWYQCQDGTSVCFRSTWEYKMAKYLDTKQVDWVYEPISYPVTYGGKQGTYTPDFACKLGYIEVKGRWTEDGLSKFLAFVEQYPCVPILLADRAWLESEGVLKEHYTNIAFEDTFFVTAIGTGLAGYSHEEIAPMFKDAPDNCVLPVEWKTLLDNTPVRC